MLKSQHIWSVAPLSTYHLPLKVDRKQNLPARRATPPWSSRISNCWHSIRCAELLNQSKQVVVLILSDINITYSSSNRISILMRWMLAFMSFYGYCIGPSLLESFEVRWISMKFEAPLSTVTMCFAVRTKICRSWPLPSKGPWCILGCGRCSVALETTLISLVKFGLRVLSVPDVCSKS